MDNNGPQLPSLIWPDQKHHLDTLRRRNYNLLPTRTSVKDKIHGAGGAEAGWVGGWGEAVKLTPVCAERPTGAWRLIRAKILRALNWASQGQAVWEEERGVSLKMEVWSRG